MGELDDLALPGGYLLAASATCVPAKYLSTPLPIESNPHHHPAAPPGVSQCAGSRCWGLVAST
jgi:hypothetical protein